MKRFLLTCMIVLAAALLWSAASPRPAWPQACVAPSDVVDGFRARPDLRVRILKIDLGDGWIALYIVWPDRPGQTLLSVFDRGCAQMLPGGEWSVFVPIDKVLIDRLGRAETVYDNTPTDFRPSIATPARMVPA